LCLNPRWTQASKCVVNKKMLGICRAATMTKRELDHYGAHLIMRMRAAASPIRFAWAMLFALLLALRLLGSAGYMPDIERGRLTIVVCPDADLSAPLAIGGAHHHHGHGTHEHNVCPYAAAAALGAVSPDWTPVLGVVVFAATLLLGTAFALVHRRSTRDRPPAIGPPIPA
jgi:hypothetical protein